MRCFVALEFDEGAKAFLGAAAKELAALDLGASIVPEQNMHATLCFLGEISEALAVEKARALSTLSFAPFPCQLRRIGFFPNENFVRVVWAGVESGGKIGELHEKVRALVAAGTVAEKDSEFAAHVTLARVKSPKNLAALRKWAGEKNAQGFSRECTAVRVALKQTVFAPDGTVEYVGVS